MSTHQRQLIREAAKAALMTKTAAEERVAIARKSPWRTNQLPAIALYTERELVDPASRDTAPRELTRDLELVIEGALRDLGEGDEALMNALDAFATDIERAIHADDTLGGTAADALLVSTEPENFDDGQQPCGAIRMVFTVTYRTDAPAAEDVALVDLKTVDAKYTDLDGGADIHASNQAEDKLLNLDE